MRAAKIRPKLQKNSFVSPTNKCKASAPFSPNRRKLFGVMYAAEAYGLINCSDASVESLLDAASAIRDEIKGRTVTYSRKIFLPITNLCRDRCGYCTFRKDP